jgi:hypothetical protein
MAFLKPLLLSIILLAGLATTFGQGYEDTHSPVTYKIGQATRLINSYKQ